MNKIKKGSLIVVLALICLTPSFSQSKQEVVGFPFDQIINSYQFINPANLNSMNGMEAIIGYNNFNALSNDVYSLYGQFCYSFLTNDSLKTHKISFSLIPEKEGIFITRSRTYLGYSYTFPLTKKMHLSGGAQIGVVNYSVKPSIAVGGSSSSVIDASIGLILQAKNMVFAFSCNQLPQNSLELYSVPITFSRYYTFLANKYFEINPIWKIQTNVFTMINTRYSNLTGVVLLSYKNVFSFGSSLRRKYGLIPQVGFDNIRMGSTLFSFSTSYRIAINRNSVINTNRVELMLGVKIVKE